MKNCALLFFILPLLPVTVFAEETSGSCGEHCTWTMEGNTLKLSGYGQIDSQPLYGSPWYWNEENITKVVIENASETQTFTAIGSQAFCAMYRLQEVVLPEGLERIGSVAFHYAVDLENINLPSSLNYIEGGAFNMTSISDFVLPENVTLSGTAIFGSQSLESVVTSGDTNLTADMLNKTVHGSWENLELPSTLKTVYCESANASCQILSEDPELSSKVKPYTKIHTLNGDRYIFGDTWYQSISDFKNNKPVKKIYTVEEAMEATKNGDKFHVGLTYK